MKIILNDDEFIQSAGEKIYGDNSGKLDINLYSVVNFKKEIEYFFFKIGIGDLNADYFDDIYIMLLEIEKLLNLTTIAVLNTKILKI